MATTTTQEPLARHDQGPIGRDKLFIGGEWVEPSGDGTLEVIDSTTEQVMGSVPEGTAEDLDRAVAAARAASARAGGAGGAAFDEWSQVPLDDRVAACAAIGQQLAARSAEIAALIAREVGMPIELATMIQAGPPTMGFAPMPRVAERTEWEERVGNSLIVHEPVGVVGCITPWNYPLHQICAKVAPAIAAGCSVVGQPSGG